MEIIDCHVGTIFLLPTFTYLLRHIVCQLEMLPFKAYCLSTGNANVHLVLYRLCCLKHWFETQHGNGYANTRQSNRDAVYVLLVFKNVLK